MTNIEQLEKAMQEAAEAGVTMLKKSQMSFDFTSTNPHDHHKEYTRVNQSGTVSHVKAKGVQPTQQTGNKTSKLIKKLADKALKEAEKHANKMTDAEWDAATGAEIGIPRDEIATEQDDGMRRIANGQWPHTSTFYKTRQEIGQEFDDAFENNPFASPWMLGSDWAFGSKPNKTPAEHYALAVERLRAKYPMDQDQLTWDKRVFKTQTDIDAAIEDYKRDHSTE